MMMATVADVTITKENPLRQWIDFVGSPLISMLVAVLLSFYGFGSARGFNKSQILKFTNVKPICRANCHYPARGGSGWRVQ